MTARPSDHTPIAPSGIGVLLVNLGTPDAATPAAVRRYLAEFLSDRRVVELPAGLWKPILHGVVLRRRPRRSAHAYAQVWDRERNASPLRAITEDQAEMLVGAFGAGVIVDHAMRYGTPAIAGRLARLKDLGCERILLAPLYPQYCGATTASVVDEAGRALVRMRWQPALRTLPPYFDEPAYIQALADDITASLARLDFVPDTIVTSFHGMPTRTLRHGDPYYCHCRKTERLLSEALGRPLTVSFQSRFGRGRWLEPATDRLLAQLADDGKRRVAVVAPGFAADCLETLEEIAIRGQAQFRAAGGTDFAYLPCLNARPAGIAMLRQLLGRELEGWLPPA